MTQRDGDRSRFVTLASEIVSAYVSNNHVQSADLPKLLSDIHGAIQGVHIGGGAVAAPTKATTQEIRRSVTPDFLISFEDGKPYKTLRRHLTLRGLTPEAYRAKWGLDADYPMTAQSYSAQRSQLARSLGLGQQRRKSAAPPPQPEPVAQAPEQPKKRTVRRKEDA
ncbi:MULTISPECIES: MucR family transcriptional regulator [unclassified Methylobacterium]|uniref:MucR family transcriptional regulator n=1 Tax=unclassified Methylobacterium TaxID=2615210 RepID=UPI0011C1EDD1|nr:MULTISPECIES: MucR family transcriptional regulator [unclassified Methylobacterium]QEE38911.1 MucR family transcriptional regulator [Methylobacterium sp. WL1]TXN55471.1 MucR family transcriptional regulator [Methylobacterium sp. WL2]